MCRQLYTHKYVWSSRGYLKLNFAAPFKMTSLLLCPMNEIGQNSLFANT